MNVLIADDEEDVLLGLKKVINWEKNGFHICAEALTGKDALNKIKMYNPELVLMDIRMPQYSGLEIIQEAKKRGYEGEFIILSGFSAFSYAQDAINLGVISYLTKPVDEEQLEQAVLKARDRILQKNQAINKLNQYKDNARNYILSGFLTGTESPKGYDLADLGILSDQYMVIHYEYYNQNSLFSMWKLEDILQNAFPVTENTSVETVLVKTKEYLLLIGESIIRRFYHLIEHYKQGAETKSPLDSMFIVYGRPVSDMIFVPDSFRDVQRLSDRRFYCSPDQHVLSYQDISGQELRELDPNVCEETVSNIINAILAHNRGLVACSLETLENKVSYCDAPEEEIRRLITDIFLQIKQKLLCHDINMAGFLPSNKSIIDTIGSRNYLYEIIQYISEQINVCINSFATDVIEDLLYYIDHNYPYNIRLEGIAPLFGYSSSYLGKMFTQKMGDNFNTYLDRVRVKNAARMLRDKDAKVYEISESVGYRDVNYFYKKFKKYMGVTPSEYRMSL